MKTAFEHTLILLIQCCISGGAKKRVGTRCPDAALTTQPTVSTIALQPNSDMTAYSNTPASGTGGRAGVTYPPQINYSALPIQPSSMPSTYSAGGSKTASSQPVQLNYSALPIQPNSSASSHSGIGIKPSSSQPSQLDNLSPNDR